MNTKLIKDMARLSILSYKQPEEFKNYTANENISSVLKCCDKDNCGFYSSDRDCQVYTTKYDSTKLVVVFRGTESIKDAFIDLNIVRVRMDLPVDRSRPLVHCGFIRQFRTVEDNIRRDIDRYMNENPEDEKIIIYSGHSLGAVLSKISLVQFALEYPNAKHISVTFGGPRCGNVEFVKLFDELANESYRFVNQDDPVPSFPFSLRFSHVKGCKYITESNEILDKQPAFRIFEIIYEFVRSLFGWEESPIDDHSSEKYLTNLCEIFPDDD